MPFYQLSHGPKYPSPSHTLPYATHRLRCPEHPPDLARKLFYQNLFTSESKPEGSLNSSSSPTISKLVSQYPLTPRDFRALTHLCFQFRGFSACRARLGWQSKAHTQWSRVEKQSSETHAKDICSPARPETSSQHHSVAQHNLDGDRGGLLVIHHWKGSKQNSRPLGPWLLLGNVTLRPPSQTTPALNPRKIQLKTTAHPQEITAMLDKDTALKLDSLSASLTWYSCSLQLLKASVSWFCKEPVYVNCAIPPT